MDNTDGFDMVSFCPRRQAFIFTNLMTAQTFVDKFGDLLLLDPKITANEHGEFLVSPEPIAGPFDGD